MAVGILGMGAYLPPDVIDNATVSAWADVTREWIDTRTGIRERRYATSETPTSTLGVQAVRNLMRDDPNALRDVGAIIFATSTPDQPIPATAAILQDALGLSGVPAWDTNAVCSGFLFALVHGAALVQSGALADAGSMAPRVLIVAADKYSALMDRTDARTVSLFGDGAGAVVVGWVPEGYGLLAHRLYTHGEHRALVEVVAGGTRRPSDQAARDAGDHLFRMRGREVRNYLVDTLPVAIETVLEDAGLSASEIDRWVFHQANPRLLTDVARRLGIDLGRVPMTGPYTGNTGGATIPITLAHTDAARPLERGERVLFAAVGGGMNGGAAVLTWY